MCHPGLTNSTAGKINLATPAGEFIEVSLTNIRDKLVFRSHFPCLFFFFFFKHEQIVDFMSNEGTGQILGF